ncbi:MAG: YifB family Mg chelatase-like AAA ATPase [Lachnospiraceae bacterium]|nr:YifB family Mg chelatase-like AAA ATPase [Lachnospiraceae bacterium]
MYSIVATAIVQGIKSVPVYVEADVSDGMPVFEMVGFLSSEVKESKERVRTALRNSGYMLPAMRITINFIPANIRKTGSGFDLPIALSILCAMGIVPQDTLQDVFVVGEISLKGEIKPVSGILPMVSEACEKGCRKCIVPFDNAREAGLVAGTEVFAVQNLNEVIALLNGMSYGELLAVRTTYGRECVADLAEEKFDGIPGAKKFGAGSVVGAVEHIPDFAEINGQHVLKRACETAVSGMHNLLMIGPPGAGKTMAAMRIPTILPPLKTSEQMELSKIYSVCGLFSNREALMDVRPFRCPHHTITPQGLAGGGAIPRPGEISLAHKGVLFLDELPEFKKDTLEILRQPMEDKVARLVRLNGNFEYPSDFMLVAAMNPCKCGYYPDMQKCRCNAASIERYINRISQPLLDRIDICVATMQIPFEELNGESKEETSEQIRERVMEVHERMQHRFREENFLYNSQIPAAKIKEYCKLDAKKESYMEQAYKKLNLTARAYHKILKVARTLADMDKSEKIQMKHLNEAICYRNVDKQLWR